MSELTEEYFELSDFTIAIYTILEHFEPPVDAARVVKRIVPPVRHYHSIVQLARRLNSGTGMWFNRWVPSALYPALQLCREREVVSYLPQIFLPFVRADPEHLHYEYENRDGQFVGAATLYCPCGLDFGRF